MGTSIIYKNIYIYRTVMSLLYTGNYHNRFKIPKRLIINSNFKKIVELCFGDTAIASFCQHHDIDWLGFDINPAFIEHAKARGLNAQQTDLQKIKNLPAADAYLMIGSLYHFHKEIELLIEKIFQATDYFIISEPVKNLSSKKGLIGTLAKRLSNAGNGSENFRYSESSLMETLQLLSQTLNFSYTIEGRCHKDLIIVLKKNENNI